VQQGTDLLIAHGYQILFGWAFVVQFGAPLPAVPMLLGAGALAGQGKLNLPIAVAVGIGATLLADLIWYNVGRLRGNRALGILTRIALDPDSAIRRAKERFAAHRLLFLVIAKFLPGVNPLAAGVAGTVRLDWVTFLVCDVIGALLWAGGWMTSGYLAADVLSALAAEAARVGRPVLVLAAIALGVWLAFKWARRRRFLRHFRAARMTPEELKRRLDAGEPLMVVDVRTVLDVEGAPYRIPGAVRFAPADLGKGRAPFRRENTVVFYCSEPNEATSARLAIFGYKRGYLGVHPLSGGLDAWRRKDFPVEPVTSIDTSGPRDDRLH
jgi:membrane protein DedA with SNARE-associated domain/rhodanese-related sulfurtransferase